MNKIYIVLRHYFTNYSSPLVAFKDRDKAVEYAGRFNENNKDELTCYEVKDLEVLD